jgi:MSHA biogenesis protein MshE
MVVAARKKVRLGDLLVEHKVVSEQQLEAALEEQKKNGRKLGRILVDQGFISETELLAFLSRRLQIPYVDLKGFRFRPDLVRLLPETHARRFRALVLDRSDGGLLVGMADPTDIFAYDELSRLLRAPLQLAVVGEVELVTALNSVYRRTEEISSLAEELGEEMAEGDFDLNRLAQLEGLSDAPVVRLLKSVFEDAIQTGASDIHIEPGEHDLRIRQRIDGVLHEQVMKEKRIAPALVSRLKLMSGLDISEKRMPQDGRFNMTVNGHSIDVRLSTMPVQHGESVVMRLLDQSAGLLALDALGMEPELLARFRRLIHLPAGMVLVTGPTGSGKTTTLYAALSELNSPSSKIITVEDPVEYRLARVNQVQVNPKIELSFARILRAALRQDPDIVLVGEMRDEETVEIGLRAALTGHLVLSTLHTNSALATASRLLDMGAAGYLVASALRAVLSQRLVRRICENCRAPAAPDDHQLAWLEGVGAEISAEALLAGRGCSYCGYTGYRGRVGVYELLEIDGRLADALRRGDLGELARLASRATGFRTVTRAALAYVEAGVTSVEEVMRITASLDEDVPLGLGAAAAPAGWPDGAGLA